MFLWRRASISVDQRSVDVVLRSATRSTERAPCTINVLRYASPRLLIPCNKTLPPLERCRGTSPNQAANSRPLLKHLASPIDATNAVAVSGPIPGDLSEFLAFFVASMPRVYLLFQLFHLAVELA